MLKTTISTVRLFFCLELKSRFAPYRPQNLPSTYDINASLYTNISRTNSIEKLFELHSCLRPYYTEKHIAITSRSLMQLVKRKVLKNGQWLIEEKYGDNWRMLLQDMTNCKTRQLSKDTLIDLVHFIYRSNQIDIDYNALFPQLTLNWQHFKKALIDRITSPQILQQYSIANLVSLLHYLIAMGQTSDILAIVLETLQQKLISYPFCTIFHLILMNSNLRTMTNFIQYQLNKDKAAQLTILIANIAADQLSTILPYIGPAQMIQLYILVARYNRKKGQLLLHHLEHKLRQYTSSNQEYNIYTDNANTYLGAQLKFFIKIVKPVKSVDLQFIKQTLLSFKLPSRKQKKTQEYNTEDP